MLYRLSIIWFFFLMISSAYAQNCNYDEMTRKLIEEQPEMAKEIQRFEEKRALLSNTESSQRMGKIIPVVVHVIHGGEAIGSGSNLSVQRITSQIQILNEDFQRTNTDANQTPSAFQSVAANTGIQFGLAIKDPSGNSTNGITRHQYNNIPNTNYIESTIKPATIWDPLNYLNIWVVDLPSSTIIGYSYLPTTTMVGSNKDGLVVTFEKFGYISSSNRGRTATHEIGHYLGLQHIWGPNDTNGDPIGCSVDDEVSDTPNQDAPYFGCPNGGVSCGSTDMNMNYMDYVEDNCMNLFTGGQSNVMNNILDGIREELIEGNLTGNTDDCQAVSSGYNFGFEPTEPAGTWSVEDANGDSRSWIITDQSSDDWGPNTGQGLAIYLWNPDGVTAADDYLFSPCFNLQKDHDYRLTFSIAIAEDVNAVYPEKLEVGFSGQASSSDFYTINNTWIFDPASVVYPSYETIERVFTVNSNIETHIGFHVFSDADKYGMQLDDIKIDDLGLVGTRGLDKIENVQVLPNPTEGYTEIILDPSNWEKRVELQIFNSLGALISQKTVEVNQSKIALDLSDQPAGVYLYRLSDGKSHAVHKIVKH